MSKRTDYWREYARRRYRTDPEFRRRRIESVTGRPIVEPPPFRNSLHHADEMLRCFTCRVTWPCQPWLDARRRAPRRVVVIYPELGV
jgi:hypothetical protein